MRAILAILSMCCCSPVFGQIDLKGKFTRVVEQNTLLKPRESIKVSNGAYARTLPTTSVEKLSKSRILPGTAHIMTIDYPEYLGQCDRYFNPFKKRACKNRFNYLKQAHTLIIALVNSPTINTMDQGVKERIMLKYASIVNMIYEAFEIAKARIEEETYFRSMIMK